MICIFCSNIIEKNPIPVNLEFFPPLPGGREGHDTLMMKYCHLSCYADILKNTALAAKSEEQ